MKRFVTFTLVIIVIVTMLVVPANAACVTKEEIGGDSTIEKFEVYIEILDNDDYYVTLRGVNEFADHEVSYYCNYYPKGDWLDFMWKCYIDKIEG